MGVCVIYQSGLAPSPLHWQALSSSQHHNTPHTTQAWLGSLGLHNLLKLSSRHLLGALSPPWQKHATSVSFVLCSSFWVDFEHDRGRSNEHGHEKLVAWQLCLCTLWILLWRKYMGGNMGRGEVRGCGKDSGGLAPTAVRKSITLKRLKVFYRVIGERERER